MKAGLLAFLMASSALGAQNEAISLSEAYRFEKQLECGKHLLPASVCYPLQAYETMNTEVQRLQAVEKEHKAESGRFAFMIVGFSLGIALGLILGGLAAWAIHR